MSSGRAMAVAAVLVTAACGMPVSEHATTLDDDEVPFGLLDPEPRSPSEAALPPGGAVADIYFTEPGGRLAVVLRQVADGSLESTVDELLEGPSDLEAQEGLGTALAGEESVRSIELSGGVATVDLDEAFGLLDGRDQRITLAQLVFTLTGRPGVGRVSFTVQGDPVDIPRGDGTLTSGSVSRDAYREFAPREPR